MVLNIIRIISSVILIFAVLFGMKYFNSKIKMKEIYKKVIISFVFAILSIACSFLSLKLQNGYIVSLNYVAILTGGLLFGGPVGIVSGVMAGLERYFAISYGALNITRVSLAISLVFTGALSTFIGSIINKDKKLKILYAIVTCFVCEAFSGLMVFLTNMSNLKKAYEVVVNTIFIETILNVCAVFVIYLGLSILYKEKLFKKEKPTSIQSKVQINLGIAMIVGLLAVVSIAYGVLDNISKESVKSTINMTIDDTITNVKSDIDAEIETKYNDFLLGLRQSVITITKDEKTISNYCTKFGFTSGTLFTKDGLIEVSNDPYIKTLSNIFEANLNIPVLTLEEKYQIQYSYYQPKDVYAQFICQLYNRYNDDLYVLAEIDTEQYVSFIQTSLEKGIASRHIGEDGFIIVTDSESNILSTPIEVDEENLEINQDSKHLDIITINGEKYYYYSYDFEGYNFSGFMNKKSADLNKNISIAITSLTAILVFFALYLIIFFSIKSIVIKPLIKVNDSLDKICDGMLEEKVNEYSSKELKFLSDDINQTVDSLKEYMGKEAKMIQKELNFAKEIQYSALPSTFPPFPSYKEFDLFATMLTAKEVGGDFYDFYLVDDRHLCILIADVSGKGVPAALFMMQSKSLIKSYIESKIPLSQAMNLANKKICESNTANMFVTVWCGIIDLDTGVLEYVNAGHNKPLIKNQTDNFEFLDCKPGFIFGVMDTINYKSQTVQLDKNSIIYLYTDGVNEASNTSKELYGNDRMVNSANNYKDDNCDIFCKKMLDDIKAFTLDTEQSDDITQLILKYYG